MKTRLTQLIQIPAMETGAPDPAARLVGTTLYVSYVCHNPQFPGWESGESIEHSGFDVYCAVLRFRGVTRYVLDGPGEEALPHHPLYEFGLRPYGFYLLEASTETADVGHNHWILTFHDESFEIFGEELALLSARVDTDSTVAAIDELIAVS